MRTGEKPTKAEFEEYKQAKRVQFEEWVKRMDGERSSKFTKAEMRAFEKDWKAVMKGLSKCSWEKIDEHDEIDRLTMDPNFDERTYEEELFGPLDDDDCYTPDGYYVYADRYDEAAKQRPPVKSNNNMEGTMPTIMILEGTPPLRGEPYPTL